MISQAYLDKLEMIESGGNPLARNKNSTAKGSYQFINSTAKQYGLKDPYDSKQSRKAALEFSKDNYNVLKKKLGRDPTEGELYLAHQQGAGGAAKLLMNPDVKAKDLVGVDAVKNNRGNEEMTAQEFANLWTSKFQMEGGEGESLIGDAGEDNLGLTPEEEEELKALEAEFGEEKVNSLTTEEEAELAELEAEFSQEEVVRPDKGIGFDKGKGSAFGTGLTGGQIPFGNVITSGIAAGALAPFTDLTFKELYDQAQADTKATQEANPGSALAGNVTGILSTLPLASSKAIFGKIPTQGARGALNAIPSGLSKIDSFVRSGKAAKDAGVLAKTGSLALRSAKGAVVAAPVGALYGAGDADAGDRLEGAKRGAGMAAAVGAALPVAGAILGTAAEGTKSIFKGFKARDVEALEEAGKIIKDNSSKAYKAMRDNGAIFNPKTSQKIVDELEQTLSADGPLLPEMHGKAMAIVDKFKDRVMAGDVGLEELDMWRQLLGDVAGDFNDKTNARKATLLIKSIDDAVENISGSDLSSGSDDAIKSLKLGREEYRKARKFETITTIIRKSDGDANYLKRELKKLLDNPKKTRGFTKDELSSLKRASRLTAGEGILKMLGKFGIDLGNSRIGNTALPALAGVASGVGGSSLGIGLAVPAAGTLARSGQKLVARGKAEDLLNVIERGGKALPAQGALTRSQKKMIKAGYIPAASLSGSQQGVLQRR